MVFDFDRTDDYDSDNYLDHADEFKPSFGTRLGRKVADLGLSAPDFPTLTGDGDDEDDETIDGEWHHAEYTVAPGEVPTLKIDGEPVGEVEDFSIDHDDRLDATRMAIAEPEVSGTVRIDPHICQNCGWQIGPLEYKMVHDEKVREVNYCSGCGKPVEEVLDL